MDNIEELKSHLKRKEQECEELKSENERLQKEREKAKNYNLEYGQLLIKATNKNNKLKQTLTEIKLAITEISSIDEEGNVGCCYECSYQENLGDVLQKISEVENENN